MALAITMKTSGRSFSALILAQQREQVSNNFNLHTPTRILFGKGAIAGLREQIPHDARVLITYGGGSVKKPAFSIKFWMP